MWVRRGREEVGAWSMGTKHRRRERVKREGLRTGYKGRDWMGMWEDKRRGAQCGETAKGFIGKCKKTGQDCARRQYKEVRWGAGDRGRGKEDDAKGMRQKGEVMGKQEGWGWSSVHLCPQNSPSLLGWRSLHVLLWKHQKDLIYPPFLSQVSAMIFSFLYLFFFFSVLLYCFFLNYSILNIPTTRLSFITLTIHHWFSLRIRYVWIVCFVSFYLCIVYTMFSN